MATLIVILHSQGRPIVELAAAAHIGSRVWAPFHTLISYPRPLLFNDEWSSKYYHGISHDTCDMFGVTEHQAAVNFMVWLDNVANTVAVSSITFLTPSNNVVERQFVQKWRIVSVLTHFNNFFYFLFFALSNQLCSFLCQISSKNVFKCVRLYI
jgi:hypothetical protein